MTTEGRGPREGSSGRVREGRPRAGAGARRIALVLLLALAAVCAMSSAALASPAGAGIAARPDAGTPAPKVTQQPSSTAVEEGQPASFASAASNSPTVQWELSNDGGVTWSPIEDATSVTFSIAATTAAENGHQFRAVFTNAGGTATSKAATLTVTKKPTIVQQPVDANAQEGHEATFETKASGSPAPTAQWQESTDGGATYKSLTGVTTPTLHLSNISKTQNGWKFRVIFKNLAGEVTSEAATLHIVDPPKIISQPLSTTVTEGETATFNSVAEGNPAPTVQWEVSTDSGATWAAVPGATSPLLAIPATTPSENGYEYRAVYMNVAASATTNAAKLTVQGIPIVTAQPESTTVAAGGTASFEAAATGSPAPTVQWELSLNEGTSWTPVSAATSGKLTISGAQLSQTGNDYRAVFHNSAGTTPSHAATLTVSSTDYRAFGWGLNTRGQAGVGSNETVIPTPTGISGLHFVTAMAGGPRHSLALLAGGTVDAWGFDGHGQLGNEGEIGTKSPVAIENLSGVKAIAAGGSHSVALLKNGTVEDWGDDESGQLGNGKKVDSEIPVPVEGLSSVTAIAAGEEHTLALLSDGTVMAWGNNERGQLGTGNTKTTDTPVAVKNLSGVTAIAANGLFSMALKSDGTVVTWGDDERDQLGNQAVAEEESEAIEEEGHYSTAPVPVDGLSGVTAIAAGETHALALLGDETVVAWGDDNEGELGNGTIEPMAVDPVPVVGLSSVATIAAGEKDSAAILASGTLMVWGMNNAGSLGLGARGEAVDTPTQVTTLGEVAGVAAGGSQMLAFGEATPSVTGLTPSSGAAAGGIEVTIAGTNLTGASTVHFGSAVATSVTVNSSSSVTAVAPAGTGTVDVTVTTPAGTSATGASDRFTYLQRPTLSKISLKTGPASGGTVVTLTGTELTGATEVHFGEVATSQVTVNSPTSITVTAPANVSGTLNLTVTTRGGTSATTSKARFKYTPAIESITPAGGPLAGGGNVTIEGFGFAPGATATKFKFGKAAAKTVDCTSATRCTVKVPAGKALGTVDVRATANKANSTPSAGDRYTFE
ncbi:MAG TPA: IPT/TIG domain-containing protein [Solirubrobacteraceae bacterium]|nr:IPT/TIG domain-containing protein [Solirubrobacteraceae bacterium]